VAISAAVERHALVAAGIALLDVTRERGSAAALDRTRRAQLRATEATRALATESPHRLGERLSATSKARGRTGDALKYCGGAACSGGGTLGSRSGSRSNGLVVLVRLDVATFK